MSAARGQSQSGRRGPAIVGKSPMKKSSATAKASTSKLISDFLGGGLTVTVGGVPIFITLGEAPARKGKRPVERAAAAPKVRRKVRRRKSRRAPLPDPRDIRGYLATQMEGATLTGLALHFKVKRPQMKKMLARLLAKKEITLFKGAYFNNKRLRQRRIATPYEATLPARPMAQPVVDDAPVAAQAFETPVEAVAPLAPVEAAPEPEPAPAAEPVVEAQPTGPTAVPDPEPEEHADELHYPEKNAA
jgi:hypothetical protein